MFFSVGNKVIAENVKLLRKRVAFCSLFSDWNRNFRIGTFLAEIIASYKTGIQHILFL